MSEEKENKETKEKKEKKKSLGQWFREMRSELKKITWPTPQKTAKDTGIVLLCSLCVGVCIWLFDAVSALTFRTLLNVFGS